MIMSRQPAGDLGRVSRAGAKAALVRCRASDAASRRVPTSLEDDPALRRIRPAGVRRTRTTSSSIWFSRSGSSVWRSGSGCTSRSCAWRGSARASGGDREKAWAAAAVALVLAMLVKNSTNDLIVYGNAILFWALLGTILGLDLASGESAGARGPRVRAVSGRRTRLIEPCGERPKQKSRAEPGFVYAMKLLQTV